MDMAECAFCQQEEKMANMLIPCSCNHWVHRTCLDKRRIADAQCFTQCRVCHSIYNLEHKQIAKWQKSALVIGCVLLDLMCLVLLLTATSFILGTSLIAMKCETTMNPGALGALVILGTYGVVSLIVGLTAARWQHPQLGANTWIIMFPLPIPCYDCCRWWAIIELVLLLILAIPKMVSLVVIPSLQLAYVPIKARIDTHRRAVAVMEFVVVDYLQTATV
jgi:hypothetical protein